LQSTAAGQAATALRGGMQIMAENEKALDDLEELFKTFDQKHSEVQQKFYEVEKNLLDFRKEQDKAAGEAVDIDAQPGS
jgi:septation ring formation regulator EzrA